MAPGSQSGGTDRSRHGKKRMLEYDSVSIPQETFIAIPRRGDEG
jgi:translation elongation factor EF-4